jgi:hypothetical protein
LEHTVNTVTKIIPEQALASQLEAPFSVDLRAAMDAGRKTPALMREVLLLYRGPGRLTPHEYFYYQLWDSDLDLTAKRKYVGKAVQMVMHHACNDIAWGAVAHDKFAQPCRHQHRKDEPAEAACRDSSISDDHRCGNAD